LFIFGCGTCSQNHDNYNYEIYKDSHGAVHKTWQKDSRYYVFLIINCGTWYYNLNMKTGKTNVVFNTTD